jgi:HlyD family secretion protein
VSRRAAALTGLVVVGLAAAAGAAVLAGRATSVTVRTPLVPTTPVVRGAVDLTMHLAGQLNAVRQAPIQAPSVGGTLFILESRVTGERVEEGDVLMVFDPTEQQFALEQALSQVAEAEQEIIKRRADAAVQAAEDRVALLSAQYDVRRAELEAAVDADLVAANEYRIRQVSLEEARRRLAQVEQDVTSRAQTGQAAVAVLEERRAKALTDADRARENLEKLEVRAPMAGVVSIRENTNAAGGIIISGMGLPPYAVGDAVNAGRPVVDVFDVSGMDIRATVNEQERTNLTVGQTARVEPAALPGTFLDATVTAISGVGRAVRTAGPLRQFDVTLTLDTPDPRLPPGTSVFVAVDGPTIDDVLVLPRQAVFDRDGKPVVYRRVSEGFEPTEIAVLHRSETHVALDGLEEGDEVALVDPASATAGGAAPATALPGGGGP